MFCSLFVAYYLDETLNQDPMLFTGQVKETRWPQKKVSHPGSSGTAYIFSTFTSLIVLKMMLNSNQSQTYCSEFLLRELLNQFCIPKVF